MAISGEKNIATTACVAYGTTTIHEQQAIAADYEIPVSSVVGNPRTIAVTESEESGDEEYMYMYVWCDATSMCVLFSALVD